MEWFGVGGAAWEEGFGVGIESVVRDAGVVVIGVDWGCHDFFFFLLESGRAYGWV